MNTRLKKINAWERQLEKSPRQEIFKIALFVLLLSITAGVSLQKVWGQAQLTNIEAREKEMKEQEKLIMEQRIDWIKEQRFMQRSPS